MSRSGSREAHQLLRSASPSFSGKEDYIASGYTIAIPISPPTSTILLSRPCACSATAATCISFYPICDAIWLPSISVLSTSYMIAFVFLVFLRCEHVIIASH